MAFNESTLVLLELLRAILLIVMSVPAVMLTVVPCEVRVHLNCLVVETLAGNVAVHTILKLL